MAERTWSLANAFRGMFNNPTITDETWDDLEDALITADFGPDITDSVLEDLRASVAKYNTTDPADLKRMLREGDEETRAYWVGALLREANTRDVWLFVTPDEVRALWARLVRHLGRSREMWAWLLGLEASPWPPAEARSAR